MPIHNLKMPLVLIQPCLPLGTRNRLEKARKVLLVRELDLGNTVELHLVLLALEEGCGRGGVWAAAAAATTGPRRKGGERWRRIG